MGRCARWHTLDRYTVVGDPVTQSDNWSTGSRMKRGKVGQTERALANTSEAENCAFKSHLDGRSVGRARWLPAVVHYLHNSISRLINTDWRIIQRRTRDGPRRAEWCDRRPCHSSWFSSAARSTNDSPGGATEPMRFTRFFSYTQSHRTVRNVCASNPLAARPSSRRCSRRRCCGFYRRRFSGIGRTRSIIRPPIPVRCSAPICIADAQ